MNALHAPDMAAEGTRGNGPMRSKIGSTILACLLYSQAFFGIAAVAAVIMKDRTRDQAAMGPTEDLASTASLAMP